MVVLGGLGSNQEARLRSAAAVVDSVVRTQEELGKRCMSSERLLREIISCVDCLKEMMKWRKLYYSFLRCSRSNCLWCTLSIALGRLRVGDLGGNQEVHRRLVEAPLAGKEGLADKTITLAWVEDIGERNMQEHCQRTTGGVIDNKGKCELLSSIGFFLLQFSVF